MERCSPFSASAARFSRALRLAQRLEYDSPSLSKGPQIEWKFNFEYKITFD